MAKLRPLGPHDRPFIGPYRVIGILGKGGQGNVYLGRRQLDGRLAAVKVLHFDDGADAARRRLRREITNAQRVPPHWTAGIIDADLNGPIPYVATEYIEGETLHELVTARGPLPPERLHRLAVQTIDALEVIHAHHVVHRDFKPGNVIRGPDGWVVIDFGIARVVGTPDSTGTRGTCAYMAPEQLRGEDVYATDLFAWASTMVFAATGRPAFEGPDPFVVMRAISEGQPDLHGLGGYLGDIVRGCFPKKPSERLTIASVRGLLRVQHASEPPLRTTSAARTARSGVGVRVAAQPRTRVIPAVAAPPAKPGRQSLARTYSAVLVACALVLAGAVWGMQAWGSGNPGKPGSSAAPMAAMPNDLRDFAPRWPHAQFSLKAPESLSAGERPTIVERWTYRLDGNIDVTVIRYVGVGQNQTDPLTEERSDLDRRSNDRDQAADWKKGTATSPAGQQGAYIEFGVTFRDGTGKHVGIWWDSTRSQPHGRTVLQLHAPSGQSAQLALDRLRAVFAEHGYHRP